MIIFLQIRTFVAASDRKTVVCKYSYLNTLEFWCFRVKTLVRKDDLFRVQFGLRLSIFGNNFQVFLKFCPLL